MAATLVTVPTDEPFNLAELKAHLRVTATAEDDVIHALATAARQRVEEEIKRALITQTWDYKFDWFEPPTSTGNSPLVVNKARIIELPRPPLQSVSYVTYLNSNQNTIYLYDAVGSPTVTSSLVVDSTSSPGRIIPSSQAAWPTAYDQINAITVRYVAGYGDTGDSVPTPIKQAILLLVGHWYENRETVNIGNITTEIPMTVEFLLAPYRIIDIF